MKVLLVATTCGFVKFRHQIRQLVHLYETVHLSVDALLATLLTDDDSPTSSTLTTSVGLPSPKTVTKIFSTTPSDRVRHRLLFLLDLPTIRSESDILQLMHQRNARLQSIRTRAQGRPRRSHDLVQERYERLTVQEMLQQLEDELSLLQACQNAEAVQSQKFRRSAAESLRRTIDLTDELERCRHRIAELEAQNRHQPEVRQLEFLDSPRLSGSVTSTPRPVDLSPQPTQVSAPPQQQSQPSTFLTSIPADEELRKENASLRRQLRSLQSRLTTTTTTTAASQPSPPPPQPQQSQQHQTTVPTAQQRALSDNKQHRMHRPSVASVRAEQSPPRSTANLNPYLATSPRKSPARPAGLPPLRPSLRSPR